MSSHNCPAPTFARTSTGAVLKTVCALAAAFVCLVPLTAECQTATPQRPDTGLFAGGRSNAASSEGLSLLANAYEAYDTDVLDEGTPESQPSRPTGPQVSGFYSGVGAGLAYARRGDALIFDASARGDGRFYPKTRDLASVQYEGRIGMSAALGQRANVQANASAGYAPFFSLMLFPVLPSSDDPSARALAVIATESGLDYTVDRSETYLYTTGLAFDASITQRTSLRAFYGRRSSDFIDTAIDHVVQTSGGGISYQASRNASLELGYSVDDAQYEGSLTATGQRTQNVNAGMRYHRPLSRTRRTHLGFASGMTLVELDRRREYRLVGSASLTHQVRRSWTAALDYQRGVGYVNGFEMPLFSDTASATVQGLFSQRVEFSAAARYATGTVGFAVDATEYNSATASLQVRTALTRSLAAYVQYVYYQYEFDQSVTLPLGLNSTLNRNGVRVGLSLWLPLTH